MVYLDNASTTKVHDECVKILNEYMSENYFNPSAMYHQSLELTKKIKTAREDVLKALHGNGQIIFTSSGTESDNMALFGTKKANGGRIIVSYSEHPAVFNAALELKQRGYDVVFCEVDNTGRIIEENFRTLMTKDTCLVSIMHVNNETGCVNDVKKLCSIAKSINPNVIFHSDGVQAVGKIKVSLTDLGVDLYTISGHKIHAPKGVAGLFIKKGVNVKPLIYGGGQEGGLRSSTENVAGIMAFSYAIQEAVKAQKENEESMKALWKDLCEFMREENCVVVDSGTWQSPYVMCAAIKSVRGEVLLHSLEKYGILIGTGSACSSKKGLKKLPTILKLLPEYENGIIRLSFSRFTTKDDIEYFKKHYKMEYIKLYKYAN